MRECAWCHLEIPATARRDAVTCSKRCRQARHRFTTAVGSPTLVADGQPRRLAYADPPYPGMSARYYGGHPDYAGEVDHAELIASLSADYDAWALSTSAAALRDVLALCPPDARVAAWVRGSRRNKAATGPESSWEPVIYAGRVRVAQVLHDETSTRSQRDMSRDPGADASCTPADATHLGAPARRDDSLVFAARARTTDPDRVIGAKPATFARWIFELLGAQPYDDLVDVFPGSGGIGRAWEIYSQASCRTVVEHDALLELVSTAHT